MLFKDRVLKTVRQHGEVTVQPKGSVINFLSCYHGHWKAFRVKAHGRLSKRRLEDLEDYQRNTGITVILVSEQADHVPRFEALNRYLKWRAGIKARYEWKEVK
jgi:hypothetical protein